MKVAKNHSINPFKPILTAKNIIPTRVPSLKLSIVTLSMFTNKIEQKPAKKDTSDEIKYLLNVCFVIVMIYLSLYKLLRSCSGYPN